MEAQGPQYNQLVDIEYIPTGPTVFVDYARVRHLCLRICGTSEEACF